VECLVQKPPLVLVRMFVCTGTQKKVPGESESITL